MMDTFERILEKYGQDVMLCYGDGRPERAARAFFQPMTDRRENRRQEEPTPLGITRRERFLYLGEPGVALDGDTSLLWKGRRFELRAWEPVYIGEKLNHWWGIAALM